MLLNTSKMVEHNWLDEAYNVKKKINKHFHPLNIQTQTFFKSYQLNSKNLEHF